MTDLTDKYIEEINGAASASASPPVWVKGDSKTGSNNIYLTPEQMINNLDAQSAIRSPEYNKIVQNLYAANFISKTQTQQPTSVSKALAYPIQIYQAYSSRAGDDAVSFNKWFDWYASTATPADGGGVGGGGGGGYSGPVTTTSVSITDENTAEALLDKYARDLVGRGLTEKERSKYIKQFNKAEMESPQVTVSDGSGASRTSTTTSAPSKEEMLREIVSKNPDYAKFQVDTTIMDLLMDDIRKGQEVING